MTPEEAKKNIGDILRENMLMDALDKHPSLVPDLKLNDDLGLDSLDKVDISLEIESVFGFNLPDEAYEEVKTVEDLEELVLTYMKG